MKVDNLLPGVVEPSLGIYNPPHRVVSANMVQVYSTGGVGQSEARVVKYLKVALNCLEDTLDVVLDLSRKIDSTSRKKLFSTDSCFLD